VIETGEEEDCAEVVVDVVAVADADISELFVGGVF